jgi:hypothetical protein
VGKNPRLPLSGRSEAIAFDNWHCQLTFMSHTRSKSTYEKIPASINLQWLPVYQFPPSHHAGEMTILLRQLCFVRLNGRLQLGNTQWPKTDIMIFLGSLKDAVKNVHGKSAGCAPSSLIPQ